MTKEAFFHDWLFSYLQGRLARDYKEILANSTEEHQHEFNGHYPDLILANQGMVLAIMEVETEESIIAAIDAGMDLILLAHLPDQINLIGG